MSETFLLSTQTQYLKLCFDFFFTQYFAKIMEEKVSRRTKTESLRCWVFMWSGVCVLLLPCSKIISTAWSSAEQPLSSLCWYGFSRSLKAILEPFCSFTAKGLCFYVELSEFSKWLFSFRMCFLLSFWRLLSLVS